MTLPKLFDILGVVLSRRDIMTEYSRSERRRQQERLKRRERKSKPVTMAENHIANGRPVRIKAPAGQLLLVSFLLSLFSVANPFLRDFADSIQSQYLYAGQAMLSGQVIYTDFYGSSGLLYYFIGGIGNLFNTTLILILAQMAALYFAGAQFYRIMAYLSSSFELAKRQVWIFYLLLAVLGFGGLYPTLFAMPFLLNALWFLLRYFSQRTKDEAFIGYGFNAGLVFLTDPKASLLWLVAAVVLLVYNIRNHNKARGFYQALGTFFGFSLIIYTIGYYTVLNKNFAPAIAQTFLYQVRELGFNHSAGFQNLYLIVLFLLGSGLITSLFYGFLSFGRGRDREFKFLLLLLFLVHLAEIFALPRFFSANLLTLLPFGLLLTGAYMADTVLADAVKDSGQESSFKSYFALNGFLPIVAVLYLVTFPIWQFFSASNIRSERQLAADHIREKTSAKERIYAWDDSALIYLKSQRLSSEDIITPDTYLSEQDNQDHLSQELSQHRPKFILVRKSEKLLGTVENLLATDYETVDLGLKDFSLYQVK